MVNVIDYIPGNTILHRLNPVAKLGLAAGIIIATFLAQTYPMLLGLLVLTWLLAAYVHALSRMVSLAKLLVPLAIVMFILQMIIVQQGKIIWGFITVDGANMAAKMVLRLIGIALPLVLMLMVTKITDLANAVVEILHVPYRYAFAFTTALRFVPVFSREMNAIMEAQTARGIEYDTSNPFRKLQLMLPLCIPLLISSVSKTDDTALAAEERGFYLRTRASSYKRYPLHAADVVTLIFAVTLICLGLLF